MARVNVGINPRYLADQHLIAESVEITMITGSLKKTNFIIKSEIPEEFKLGIGHMNFFKTKILYLYNRLLEVNNEMHYRGFKVGTKINLEEYPNKFKNNWKPTYINNNIIKERIIEKVNKKDNMFWRYFRDNISNEDYCKMITTNGVYKV